MQTAPSRPAPPLQPDAQARLAAHAIGIDCRPSELRAAWIKLIRQAINDGHRARRRAAVAIIRRDRKES
jgi:hypothetical protein